MKNKTNPSTKHKVAEKYLDLFYMTPNKVTAKDITEILKTDSKLNVQLWEEMNVLELEFPGEKFVDFEPVEPAFKDPSDAAFLKNRNITTIFAININEDDLDASISYLKLIVDQFGGFVCSDSADFQPVYVGSVNRNE